MNQRFYILFLCFRWLHKEILEVIFEQRCFLFIHLRKDTVSDASSYRCCELFHFLPIPTSQSALQSKWLGEGHYVLSLSRFFFFVFLGLHSWHMEAPRIGVQSELKLQSWSCRPRPTPQPQQRRILNPLNKARDRTCVLTDTNRVCQLLNHDGSSRDYFLLLVLFQNPVKNNDFEPAFWDLT